MAIVISPSVLPVGSPLGPLSRGSQKSISRGPIILKLPSSKLHSLRSSSVTFAKADKPASASRRAVTATAVSNAEAQGEGETTAPASTAKSRLLAHLDLQDENGAFTDEAFAELGRLVDATTVETKFPAPLDSLPAVVGSWDTVFAHFGAKHSAGKPKVHDSDLKKQSFGRFPAVPVRVTRLRQEISDPPANVYSNVIDFTAASDGVTRGVLIVHGRYVPDQENRQRFHAEFYAVELRPVGGGTEDELREALGFPAEQPMRVEFTVPSMHSDVIYLDDELRINVGGMGGLYVLKRVDDALVSM
eukprot:TRINITY_DN10038_c0_g1_i1.p1 TRINITY_DN10038_c0_g1~~TRINITY_DN10038_c0_g1_i1.p1  ORF type:complete len:340 (+),score=-11.21 TRINITY_DN10038_c0_g1_i1:113-1021(+)